MESSWNHHGIIHGIIMESHDCRCLRVRAACEWVPLGGEGSVHPGERVLSPTEDACTRARVRYAHGGAAERALV
jgi:hypothetical protein